MSLPTPNTPYSSPTLLVKALADWGADHMDRDILTEELVQANEDTISNYCDPLEGRDTLVRSSGGLNCAGQAYLIGREGCKEDDQERKALTFSVGHWHHAIVYAAIRSALKGNDAIQVEIEKQYTMPDWWPQGENYTGVTRIDLLFDWSKGIGTWLPEGTQERMVVDVKSKPALRHQQDFRSKAKEIEPTNEVWGLIPQLALYNELAGLPVDSFAMVLATNKEAPANKNNHYAAKLIWPDALEEGYRDLRRRVAAEEFDPELLRRKGAGEIKAGFLPCQGYCPVQAECERRRPEGLKV